MTTLQTNRLKTSRTGTETEDGNNHSHQPIAIGTSDGEVNVDLPALPSYDREYNAFLTLEEAVGR